MNVMEVLLATVLSVLAAGGASYIYTETLEQRSAERVNAVLSETAANAAKAGPKVAEMSRADVQKLGIVPEALLDRRRMQSKGAGGVAWKNWIASTGSPGVEIVTAGVRENGLGYFRVYLDNVPSGVCARVFTDQVRESGWTSFGISAEDKISRAEAESNPGILRSRCGASSYRGGMVFEREIGSLAIVYLGQTAQDGGEVAPLDDWAAIVPGAGPVGGGTEWIRDLAPGAEPPGAQSQSDLGAGVDGPAIANSVLSAQSGGGASGVHRSTGGVTPVSGVVPGGGSAPEWPGASNDGYAGRAAWRIGGGAFDISGAFGAGAIHAGASDVSASQRTDIAVEGGAAGGSVSGSGMDVLTGEFSGVNLAFETRSTVDGGSGAVEARFSSVKTVEDAVFSDSTLDMSSQIWAETAGPASIAASGLEYGTKNVRLDDGSSVSASAEAWIDASGASAPNSASASGASVETLELDGGSIFSGHAEVHLVGGSDKSSAFAWGIGEPGGPAREDSEGEGIAEVGEGSLLSGTAEVEAACGLGDCSAGGAGIWHVGVLPGGGDVEGILELNLAGNSGTDSTSADSAGIGRLDFGGMDGGSVYGEANCFIDGGEGGDSLHGCSGIGEAGTGSLSGVMEDGTVTGSSFSIVDGGDGDDFIQGGSGIGSFSPEEFSGGSVTGKSVSILAGGAGSDEVRGGSGIGSASAEPMGDAVLSGWAANLISGGQRLPLASMLESITGMHFDENDGEGIVQAIFALSPDQLRRLGTALSDWELSSDAGDVLYGGGSSHEWSTELNFIAGGAGNDAIYGGSGAGAGNILYGGTGGDEIHGGDGGASNTAFGGSGNDSMIGGAGEGTVNEFYGGNGADEIAGGDGAKNLLHGEAGDDLIRGGANGADNSIWGGEGHDWLYGGDGAVNRIWAGDGGSRLQGGSESAGYDSWSALYGGEGSDFLSGGSGNVRTYAFGGGGADTVRGGADAVGGHSPGDLLAGDGAEALEQALAAVGAGGFSAADDPEAMRAAVADMSTDNLSALQGVLQSFQRTSDGSDHLTGSSGDDVILAGGGGANILYGLGGDDILLGGSGNDAIFGGSAAGSVGGSDRIFAGSGNDIVWHDASDAIDCGADADILLNAGLDDLARTAGCEYAVSAYEYDGQEGWGQAPENTVSQIVVYSPGETPACTGREILLGADRADLAGSGCAGALERADPMLEGATSLENLTPETLAEELGIAVDEDGVVWILDPSRWSPTDEGAWRDDAGNWLLHGGNVRMAGTGHEASCTEDEIGASAPDLSSYTGWDKLYGAGIAITKESQSVTLSYDWKPLSGGGGWVNCGKGLVIMAGPGQRLYRWPEPEPEPSAAARADMSVRNPGWLPNGLPEADFEVFPYVASTNIDLGLLSGTVSTSTGFVKYQDGFWVLDETPRTGEVLRTITKTSASTGTSYGVAVSGGTNKYEMEYNTKAKRGQGAVFDLDGVLAGGLTFRLTKFVCHGAPLGSDEFDEQAKIIFFRNGHAVAEMNVASAAMNGIASFRIDNENGFSGTDCYLASFNGSLEGGFDKFVIAAADTGTKKTDNSDLFLAGLALHSPSTGDAASAAVFTGTIVSLTESPETAAFGSGSMQVDFGDGIVRTAILIPDEDGKTVRCTYMADCVDIYGNAFQEERELFRAVLGDDGSWVLNAWRRFSDANSEDGSFVLPFQTAEGAFAIPMNASEEAAAGTAISIETVGTVNNVLDGPGTGTQNEPALTVQAHIDASALWRGSRIRILTTTDSGEQVRTLVWNGSSFDGADDIEWNPETATISWNQQMPLFGALDIQVLQERKAPGGVRTWSGVSEWAMLSQASAALAADAAAGNATPASINIRETGRLSNSNYIWTDKPAVQSGSFATAGWENPAGAKFHVTLEVPDSFQGGIFEETVSEDGDTVTCVLKKSNVAAGAFTLTYSRSTGAYTVSTREDVPWGGEGRQLQFNVEVAIESPDGMVLSQKRSTVSLYAANDMPKGYVVNSSGKKLTAPQNGGTLQVLSSEDSRINSSLRTEDPVDSGTQYFVMLPGESNPYTGKNDKWANPTGTDKLTARKYSAEELLYTQDNLDLWMSDYEAYIADKGVYAGDKNKGFLLKPKAAQYSTLAESPSGLGEMRIDAATGECFYTFTGDPALVPAEGAVEVFHVLVLDSKGSYSIVDAAFEVKSDGEGGVTVRSGTPAMFQ